MPPPVLSGFEGDSTSTRVSGLRLVPVESIEFIIRDLKGIPSII